MENAYPPLRSGPSRLLRRDLREMWQVAAGGPDETRADSRRPLEPDMWPRATGLRVILSAAKDRVTPLTSRAPRTR
jgi:hypothetical protein